MAAKHIFYHHKNSIVFIIWLLFFILFIFPYPAAANSDFLSPEERQWLKEHDGKIRVGPDPYYPPLEYLDENGVFQGIAADYINLIEKKLEFTFQIVRLGSFEEILEKARNREIDVVNTVIKTPERSKYLLFTPPYIRIPNVLVVRDDFRRNISIKDLKDIDGIVYQGGYTIGSVLIRQHGIGHAQPITDPVEALKDLSMGRINVMAGNLAVISHYVRKMKLTNLRIAGDCEFDDVISFASRRDRPILNHILDKALREISSEEREIISDKWIKLDLKKFYQDKRFWFSVIGILGIFAAIITLFYIWNRTLKKQVGIKTLELKQREEALRRSEEKYRCLVENANEAIVVAQDGRLVFVNPMAIELTGYSEQELVSRPFLDFIHPDDRNLLSERHQQRLKGTLFPSRYSFRMIRLDRTVKFVEISTVLIDWEGRPATLNFINDITEHLRIKEEKAELESQFHQAQKMESVGRLAGGVAHDFNNMLGVILGHTEMVLDQVDPSQPMYEDLLEIQKAAQRSADLTRQLLAFARKQTISPRVLDLNDTISGIFKMLRRIDRRRHRLVWKPGANLWPVMMDPSQIDQILANLSVNARDAIAHAANTGGGNLTIETQNIVFDESYCSAHAGFMPGEYVFWQ
jgi:PAS domain S-box-containing protein